MNIDDLTETIGFCLQCKRKVCLDTQNRYPYQHVCAECGTLCDVDRPAFPAGVIASINALRRNFDNIHVMHECDENCPEDCELEDYSESAYRHHDEHNADVREYIEVSASQLLEALETWT